MSNANFFWGLIIVLLGLIFLGTNLGWWSSIMWSQLWLWWPLILVVVGLRKLITNDAIFNVLMLLLVIGLFGWLVAAPSSLPKPVGPHFGGQMSGPFTKLSGEEDSFKSEISVAGLESFLVDLSLAYDVTLTGQETTTVSVELTGPKELISDLSLTPDGSQLVLRNDERDLSGWFMWAHPSVRGTISLPKSLALELELSGATKIELKDHAAKLTIDASGASEVTMSSSTSQEPSVKLSGASKAKLAACTGSLSLDLSGASRFSADSCTLTKLNAKASGASTVELEAGTVVDAQLQASGASRIRLPKPSGKIEQDSTGASKIELE